MQNPTSRPSGRRYRRGISIAAGVLSVAMVSPFVSPVVYPQAAPVAMAQELAPAVTGSKHSTGVWEGAHTVNGYVFIDRGSGSKHYNADFGDEYIDGIQVSGYWIDEDGAKSPVYHTFSGEGDLASGHFSLLFEEWVDANGVRHTFNAPLSGEQVSIWATLPDGSQYQISFQDAYPVGDGNKRSRAIWLPAYDRVDNWHIALQDKPDPSWLSLENPTGPQNDATYPGQNGGHITGTVFWDPWTNPADFLYPSVNANRGDMLAEGITVVGSYVQDEVARRFDQWKRDNSNWAGVAQYTIPQFQAAQKQIMEAYTAETGKPAIAETVTSVTNAQGEYKLQFQGLWGNSHTNRGIMRENWNGQGVWGDLVSDPGTGSWVAGNWYSKHINSDYMYVYPVMPEGVSATMSSFQSAMFTSPVDVTIGQGNALALQTFTPINFPLYALDPKFDVTPFDSVSNPAMPGDTVQTTSSGLVPGQTYYIQWQRSTPDGLVNVGEPCEAVAGPDSSVPSCPLTVPEDLTETTIYSATLYQPAGDERNVYGVDSFAAIPNEAETPLGSLGDPYTGSFTQDVPAGASVTYSAAGLPNGLSIDPNTGEITGTPVVAEDGTSPVGTSEVVITSTITYADGNTGTVERTVEISITDTELADATLGQPYTQEVAPQGLPAGATASGISVEGLPAGLTFDPATNTISGIPSEVGEFEDVVISYTVTLEDGTEVTHQDTVSMSVVGDLAAAYAPIYEGTVAEPAVVASSQPPTFDNEFTEEVETEAAPEGTTFAAGELPADYTVGTSVDTLLPGQVFVDPQTGVVSVSPLPSGGESILEIPVIVTYADETIDEATAIFNVGADQATMLVPIYQETSAQQGGEEVTVNAPLDQNGAPLPAGTNFVAGDNFPDWATLNPDGSIIVAPGADVPVGPVDLPVTINYPDGSTEEIFAIVTVTDGVAPVISPIEDVIGTEGALIDPVTVVTDDPDATVTVEGLPEGVTFDPATGEITGTPTVPGTYEVVVTATDEAGNASTETFTITVEAAETTPDEPSINPGTAVDEVPNDGTGKVLDDTITNPTDTTVGTVVDQDGNPIEGATVDIDADGTITVTVPEGTDPGDAVVVITDGDTEVGRIPVEIVDTTPTPEAPSINPGTVVDEIPAGEPTDLDDKVNNPTDNMGGTITAEDGTPIPGTVVVDPDTGAITVTVPGDTPAGPVTIQITDDQGNPVGDPINATVTTDTPTETIADTLNPSYPTGTTVQQAPETPVTVAPTENGNPLPAEQVAGFTQMAGWPADAGWASLDITTGEITLNPTLAVAPDTYDFPVQVRYTDGSTDLLVLTVEVTEAPEINSEADLNQPVYNADSEVVQGGAIVIPAPANADGTPLPVSEDGLTQTTFDRTADTPAWVIVNTDGSLAVNPPADLPAGEYLIPVLVTYPDGSTETITAPVTVTEVADTTAPVIAPIANVTVTEDEHIAPITVSTDDPDANVTVAGLPEGLTFDAVTGQITGTPTVPGTSTVTVTASDDAGNSSTATFTITVEAAETTPDEPSINPGTAVDEVPNDGTGKVLDDTITNPTDTTVGTVVDQDGNPIEGATVDIDADGTITVTVPEGTDPGDAVVVITDGDTEVGRIEVEIVDTTPTPDEPSINPGTVVDEIPAGEPTDLDDTVTNPTDNMGGTITDENGNPIPGTVVVDPDTGVITVTVPGDTPAGPVTIQITDDQGNPVGDPINATVTTDIPTGSIADNTTPVYIGGDAQPGTTVTIPNVGDALPAGTTVTVDESNLPDGWEVSVGADGTITVTVPDTALPGESVTLPVTITYSDGSVDTVMPAVNVADETGVVPGGSSSGRCILTGMAVGLPLLFLIPVGLADQLNIPGMNPMINEIQRSLQASNTQLQNNLGIYNGPQAQLIDQIGAELGRNEAVRGAGLVLLGLLAGKLLLDACAPGSAGSSLSSVSSLSSTDDGSAVSDE